MCGIFGIVYYGNNYGDNNHLVYYEALQLQDILKSLLNFSEERGTDASGLCVVTDSMAHIFKDKERGSKLKDSYSLGQLLLEINTRQKFRCAFGHARAQTKGTYMKNENNHPIVANKTIGVHNGMIYNDETLFTDYDDDIEREGVVDSEIIFRLIDMYIDRGKSIASAVKETSRQLYGSYACAFVNLDYPHYITLFKEIAYPSIYVYRFNSLDLLIFASTPSIIDRTTDENKFYREGFAGTNVDKFEVRDAEGVRINTINGKMYCFNLEKGVHNAQQSTWNNNKLDQEMPCVECKKTDCVACAHYSGIL